MKYTGCILVAALAAAKPTGTDNAKPGDRQLAQPTSAINIQDSYRQCLTTAGEYVEWGSCDSAIQFQAPSDATQPSFLRTVDGKSCLSLIPYGPTNFPDFRILPCKDGDNNQLWQLAYGKNQIRSMTSLGVCKGPADPFVNQGPTFVSCAIGESGPVCINNDEGYASARPCSLVYEAKPVPDPRLATGPGSTVALFTAALENGAPAGVDRFMVGKVLSEHNDEALTFSADSSVDVMITQCAAKCLAIKCSEFDVVFDKKTCYFSLTGGSEVELKADLDAAAFFMS